MCATLVVLVAGAKARAEEPLARLVPADVGLYVELQQADDLLIPLLEPQLWLTLADLGGQPARLEDAEAWNGYVQQTLGMTPTEAVRTLFSRRVAYATESVRGSSEAVILCQPAVPPQTLLRKWQAQPLPTSGRTAVYRMRGQLSVALQGDTLVFGDNSKPGLLTRELRLLETGTVVPLTSDAQYQRLLARVPANPAGIVFARLTRPTPATSSAPAQSQPARPAWPTALADSDCVLLALHREGRLLRFSAVGTTRNDAPASAAASGPAPGGSLLALVAALPERTLVAWASRVDLAALKESIGRLPERNALRVGFQLQEQAGTVERLTRAMYPAVCLAVGVAMPQQREVAAPPIPALAVLAHVRDPAAAAEEWRTLFQSTIALYRLLSLKMSPPPRATLQVDTINIEGVPAERLDLSPMLGEDPAQTAWGELHICWALDGDVLMIASHTDWLAQIIAARRGKTRPLAQTVDLARRTDAQHRENIFVAQSGPLADLGALWLQYFERAAPAVLTEGWWRTYQPGGGNARLGVQVTEDGPRRRLRIQSVTPDMPADGILNVGDEIVGCNRRRFATSQPIVEMTEGLTQRPDARWIDVLVERDGGLTRARRIPLPFVDPIQMLRRVISIGRFVQRVVYVDEPPDEVGPRGYLTVELRGEALPLFVFSAPATAPASAPTSAPAPVPPAIPTSAPETAPVSAPTIAPTPPAASTPSPQSAAPASAPTTNAP